MTTYNLLFRPSYEDSATLIGDGFDTYTEALRGALAYVDGEGFVLEPINVHAVSSLASFAPVGGWRVRDFHTDEVQGHLITTVKVEQPVLPTIPKAAVAQPEPKGEDLTFAEAMSTGLTDEQKAFFATLTGAKK